MKLTNAATNAYLLITWQHNKDRNTKCPVYGSCCAWGKDLREALSHTVLTEYEHVQFQMLAMQYFRWLLEIKCRLQALYQFASFLKDFHISNWSERYSFNSAIWLDPEFKVQVPSLSRVSFFLYYNTVMIYRRGKWWWIFIDVSLLFTLTDTHCNKHYPIFDHW